jgi:hypothetical protein
MGNRGCDSLFLECCLYVEAREQLTNNLQFLELLTVGAILNSGVKLFQSLIEEGKNELRYNCNLVNGLLDRFHAVQKFFHPCPIPF